MDTTLTLTTSLQMDYGLQRRDRLSSSKFNACISFPQIDPAYVDLQQSEAEIAAALKISGESLILLHGGPGTGKSWLARRIAVHCHDPIEGESSGSRESSDIDGVNRASLSSFDNCLLLECGPGADIETKLLELLWILSPESGITRDQYHDPDHTVEIRIRLQALLQERESLIILDDVSDSEFLEAFLGISSGATLVVISRNPNLCEKFDHTSVKIQDITSVDAKRILASHAGFAHNELPSHLQEVAEQVMKITGNNPLALGMIGKRLSGEGLIDLHQWNGVLKSYSNSLTDDAQDGGETNIRCASIVGETMRLAYEDLDIHSQLVVILITICDDLSTPEQLIRIMYQSLGRDDLGVDPTVFNFFTHRQTLWHSSAAWRRFVELPNKTLSLHHMQKRFMLEKMTEVVDNAMCSLLNRTISADLRAEGRSSNCSEEATNDTLLTVLAAFYLQKQFAERVTEQHGLLGEKLQSRKFVRFALEPLIHIMDEGVSGKKLARCAKEVYVRFVIDGDFDDENLALLLCSGTLQCGYATCAALGNIALIQRKIQLELGGSLQHTTTSLLLALGSVHEQPAREALSIYALNILTQYEANIKTITRYPEDFDLLVRKSTTSSLLVQKDVASILAKVSAHSDDACRKIGRHSGVIPYLIEAIFVRPQADVELQERLLCTMANLAVDGANQDMIVKSPSIFRQLIITYKLSHQRGTTDTFLSSTCLQIRSHATRMLANLSSLNDHIRLRIGEVPDAISMFRRMLFYEETEVQHKVICLLANLSLNRTNQKMIVDVTEPVPYGGIFLQQLLDRFFSPESSSRLRKGIATMLANLTHDDNQIRRKLGGAPGAIENLLRHSCDIVDDELQAHILCSLANLALAEENRVKMLQCTPLFEQLVRSLASPKPASERRKISKRQVQKELARLLISFSLHSDHVRHWIGSIPEVIPSFLRDLEDGEPDGEVVYALATLALSDKSQEEIFLRSPDIIEELVRDILSPRSSVRLQTCCATLLVNLTRYTGATHRAVCVHPKVVCDLMAVSHGVAAELQEAVVCALANLSVYPENRAHMMEHKRFLDELVREGGKSRQMRRDVARLLAALSSGSNEIRFKLGESDEALKTLIQINHHRGEYERRQLQLSALGNLALNETTQRKILRLPAFVERLRQLFFKDVSHKLEQNVVRLLINLSSHGKRNTETIAAVPKVLSRLSTNLFEFDDPHHQSLVLRALTNLASNEANREKIMELPNFLEHLLKLVSEHKGHEEEVVTLLAYLSRSSSPSVL